MEEDLLHARGGCHVVLYGYSRAVVPNDDVVSLHAIHRCFAVLPFCLLFSLPIRAG